MRRRILLSCLCLFAAARPAPAADPPVRVLIVDGVSNHDWKLTTSLIRGILEPTGLFAVTVSTAPSAKDSPDWDTWRPRFADYDVVIQTYNDLNGGPPWPRAVQEAFETFVRNGGGVYVWHGGNNAFPDWPAYNQMLGLGWRKKNFGWALSVGDDGTITRIPPDDGPDTGHGARLDTVVHRRGDHPIHAGLPRAWMTPDIEVYYYARGPADGVDVLSYGFDPRTKMNWPLEWTTSYGKGRVYTSTFGHVWAGDTQPARMRCAGLHTVVVRALQWLAGRPVTAPIPADFPAADRVSVRPEIQISSVVAPAAAGAARAWASYAGDKASSKYSAASLIDRGNFSRLKVAWTWRSAEADVVKANPRLTTWAWESTPLMVDGVLYVSTSLSQVAALDAATGTIKWVYDPETWKNGTPSNNGFVHRGVAYWADGNDRRILFGTGDGYLIALHADTGKPVSTFGAGGRIDLTQGLGRPVDRRYYGVSSPPIVCRDVVVMGSKVHDVPVVGAMPPGDVRGFDVRTGKQVWQFRTVPAEGEFGNETWQAGSWKTTGGANVWTLISADDELGYVYLPVSTPSNDFFGGERPGAGLFGESLVCLDARTGKRVWHSQIVHHGLWDYDLPAAPNLIDIRVNGTPVKAVAQVSKQGFVYVFDRVTGRPIWPIDERPVPQSAVSGEQSSPTQPFPTKPAPFDRQGVTEADVIDFTPELRKEAQAVLAKYHYGPLYTPPSLDKPTINMPGWAGGASWAGAAWDPETGVLYIPSITSALVVTLTKPGPASPAPWIGAPRPLETMDGLPLWKPPYGRITAIDLNSGEHRWMVPMGDLDHPRLKGLGLTRLGRPMRGHPLLTKTLLIVGQEGTTQRSESPAAAAAGFDVRDANLRAYDKRTGEVVGEVALPRNVTAAPITYVLNGAQYVVVATGGANLPAELIALRLP